MKYIFIAGAPGSKWSMVARTIHQSADLDFTDATEDRIYWRNAPDTGKEIAFHTGAYFDPGMEFDLPEDITTLTKDQLEALFDRPFSGSGARIIKSHIFSYYKNIEYLKKLWPECPIVLVYRPDDACLGWWVKCGHFNITYPLYHDYYKNLDVMATKIFDQNQGILTAWETHSGKEVYSNVELCNALSIAEPLPKEEFYQDYKSHDVTVKVI